MRNEVKKDMRLEVDESIRRYMETRDEFYMLKVVELTLKYFRNEVNYLLNKVKLHDNDIKQELEQCLTLFILQSIKKYDTSTNTPFVYFIKNTYLHICIKTINELLNQYKTSRHIKIRKEINQLIKENPDLPIDKIVEIYSENNRHHRSTIEYCLQDTQVVSLETPIIAGNEEITLKDTLVSNDTVEANIQYRQLVNIVDELIEILSAKEQYIICHRFGIKDYDLKTLEEIGDELNISKERVRQLENKILSKLLNVLKRRGIDKQNLYDILL